VAAPAWLQAYYDNTVGTAWAADNWTWACRAGLQRSPCTCVWIRRNPPSCDPPCDPAAPCQLAPGGAPCPPGSPPAPPDPRCVGVPAAAAAAFSGMSGWTAGGAWTWACLPGLQPYAPANAYAGPGACVPCSLLQPLLRSSPPPAGAEWIDGGPDCTNRTWRPRPGFICNATMCRPCQTTALPGNMSYSGGYTSNTLDTAAYTGSAARCVLACNASYFPLPLPGSGCAACPDVLAASALPPSALPARARWQAQPAACNAGAWECVLPWVRAPSAAYCCPPQVPPPPPPPFHTHTHSHYFIMPTP
jgi:hypothetical protein